MKTTLEIPDPLFRHAKALAAEQGIPLRQLVTEAVQERVRTTRTSGSKPWLKLAGKLRHLRKENLRINQLLEKEFEQIEPEEWA